MLPLHHSRVVRGRRRGNRTLSDTTYEVARPATAICGFRPVRESNPAPRFRRPGSGSTGQAHKHSKVPAARFELATFGV